MGSEEQSFFPDKSRNGGMAGREVRGLQWVRKTPCSVGGSNFQCDKECRRPKVAENGFWLTASREMGTSALEPQMNSAINLKELGNGFLPHPPHPQNLQLRAQAADTLILAL